MRVGNKGRHSIICIRSKFTDDRTVRRVKIWQVSEPLIITGRRMTSQGIVASRIMILHLVVKGPYHGAFVHVLSHSWQVLTNLNVRTSGPYLCMW